MPDEEKKLREWWSGKDRELSDAIRRLAKAITELAHSQKPPKRKVTLGFEVGQPTKKGKNMPLELKITNEQKIKVTLTPKTDTGKPASLDGVPTWEVLSGSSTVEAAEDGRSAYLVSGDDPGDTQIIVKADADIGEGVEELSDVIKLSVVGATAKNLGLSAGQPEAKPDGSGDGGQTPPTP